MKNRILGLSALISLLIAGSPSLAFFESKEALFEKLYARGFQYVVEMKNNTFKGDHSAPRDNVIDLSKMEKVPYTFERVPALDYKLKVNKLRQVVYGDILAQAYNVSDVMVCYFVGDTIIYKETETCMIFPNSVTEVVRALSS